MLSMESMKVLGKVLVIAAAGAVGTAVFAYVRRTVRARGTAVGSMSVGAVDEVELSGPMQPDQDLQAFEPVEVPSEHAEINDLRSKMPFG